MIVGYLPSGRSAFWSMVGDALYRMECKVAKAMCRACFIGIHDVLPATTVLDWNVSRCDGKKHCLPQRD